ncbi:methyltransferase [Maritimibacter sp. UBA3975]|uniref:methyltransferase n=1 Tax=Maritimibacter sp. UBA3975 TaxID=1946833 RepID=UPI0025BBE59D|nr:methyltransferase [Maritimibacter sp. UBA3975]|tara:strand:+ start:11637 stop:12335 length:699 start_codon:yes stop_codon:yes gene_type:complete
MATIADIRAKSGLRQILEGQPQHVLLAVLLTIGAVALIAPVPDAPRLLGLTGTGWATLSIALALTHQVVVALGFRLQLHRALFTRLFGARDLAIWTAIFMPLLAARPITLILTGWADTVPITGLRWLEIPLGLALLAPAIWGMHSTLVHFTLRRAVGGDHFREEIRALPPVRGGVFDHTDNGMYGVVFLGFWGIALLFGSWNALVVAAFQHAYIWVHMYATEAPDMRRLYGP